MRVLGIPDLPELQETPRPNHKAAHSSDRIGVPGWVLIIEGLPVGARGCSSRNLHFLPSAIDSVEPGGLNPCKSRNSSWYYPEPNQDWMRVLQLRDFLVIFELKLKRSPLWHRGSSYSIRNYPITPTTAIIAE